MKRTGQICACLSKGEAREGVLPADILSDRIYRQMKKKRTKEMKSKTAERCLAAAVILLILSGGLMILAAWKPAFAEWYAETVYPVLVSTVGRVTGRFPFSVSEICIYLIILGLLLSVVLTAVRIIRWKEKAGRVLFQWFSGVMLTASVLAFLYIAGCGINYRRESFSTKEGIITWQYTSDDLKQVCIWLTEEVNDLAPQVSRDEDQILTLDAPEEEGAVEAMEKLSGEYSSLEGYYPRPKKLIFSEVLSYHGLTGIYLPFTIEANYNGDMTSYNKPFTACHELSHLRGFMEEREANFIAFLACAGSERIDFQYSGYLSGWVYCMNALYRADQDSWAEVRGMLDPLAEVDLAANNAFWDSYEGPVERAADRINDTYLKANGQADGVQSYDRMVDLIVAYYGNRGK